MHQLKEKGELFIGEKQSVGDIIRELRKRKHLTQEELADGICSPVTISRIENGIQMPSSKVLDMILSKLGTSTYEICNIYYKSEQQIRFEEKADYVAKLIKLGKIEEVRLLMSLLEQEASINVIFKQHYMLLQISLMIIEKYEPKYIIELSKKAIELTKKKFNYEEYNLTLLTSREANLVSMLIVGLYKNNQVNEAIHLSEALLVSMEKNKNSLKEYGMIRLNVIINLSQCLEHEKRYSEAFEMITIAEQMSHDLSEHTLLPEILFFKAKLYYYLGDKENSFNIINSIVPYMELIQKHDFAEIVRQFAVEKMKINM